MILIREVIRTFESGENPARYKSRITLTNRRIWAFEITNSCIENERSNNYKFEEEI